MTAQSAIVQSTTRSRLTDEGDTGGGPCPVSLLAKQTCDDGHTDRTGDRGEQHEFSPTDVIDNRSSGQRANERRDRVDKVEHSLSIRRGDAGEFEQSWEEV